MQEKILFIDRDGTLIDEPKDNFQIDKIEKLIFEPFVIHTLYKLSQLNFKFVLVSNQDGLYTDQFSYNSFIVPHKCMVDVFSSQGIFFDYILICPHFPEDDCNCRKPNIELVKPWLMNKNLDVNNSYVIGDRITDIELSEKMGIQGILYHREDKNWNDIYDIISKKQRYFKIVRNTNETKITIEIWLEKKGKSKINTGIGFFDHMLEQISIHSNILMNINVVGDLFVDDHHVIEDTGIVLGNAILKCLGDKIGIHRFGFHVPMDESCSHCILDLSGRGYLKFIGNFSNQFVGDFSTDMVEHFFQSLSNSMKTTVHIVVFGKNDHHKIEGIFKSFGRSLRAAIQVSGNVLPTSKGIL
ncbi:bifunctional histidinol-phosphatase/imidazoleglycerol-phosphate dehydratase HisB [Buchnera aphidicola]|uniref:bifunctional histidinol-phosphatase/imidazoleglycerol-phosphate dehydratase HisB n=1 Tax=Buchnera aphidicola TaxID=9 RepID=UPI003463CB24